LQQQDIRLAVIGQPHRLPEDVRASLERAIAETAANSAMQLNLALSYGGRSEITEMVQQVAAKVKTGALAIDAITPTVVANHLYTRGQPDPDLLIRTSGEMRISNFLLWQLAYAEIFVTDTLWPDFSREEFLDILMEFQRRERRYGQVEA
jgi:undecaprenyl diphosphate synthase